MSYCTLFCERKHSFFKRALRSTLNFKNVTKFCVEQHQYYQSLLFTRNTRLANNFFVEKYIDSHVNLPSAWKESLRNSNLLDDGNIFAEEASFRGYCYKKGSFIFLNHDAFGEYFFILRIHLIVFKRTENRILFLGDRKKAHNIHEKGLLMIHPDNVATEIHDIRDIIDKTPLSSYTNADHQYLFTKHAITLIK